ncbi:MAG: hypothetical protein ACI4EA_09945 [Candidatus Ornithomonoglobus sp.]
MKYATDLFFDLMYSMRSVKALSELESVEAYRAECIKRRSELITALGLDKIEAINFEMKTKRISDRKYDVEILPGLVTPMWILKPEKPNGKTVLYLPGHDPNGAQGSFNYFGQNQTFHKWLPLQLQFEGFTVVIPELIGFGSLIKEKYTDGFRGCFANTEILQLFGISMAGLRTYQAICAIEIMEKVMERPMSFIYGISGGGLIAMLTSALTCKAEAVVISNYGASFKSSIMEIQHCVDNYIPNLLNIGECADIIGLSAPTPIMLTNGIEDSIFPNSGVRETAAELEKIYKLFNAEKDFFNHTHKGGHETDSDAVIEFYKRYIPQD